MNWLFMTFVGNTRSLWLMSVVSMFTAWETFGAQPIVVGGQHGFYHDEGWASGVFNTFDALDLGVKNQVRKIHVYLPRNYAQNRGRYPVLFMNDGNRVFFPTGSTASWGMADVLTKLYSEGLQRVIVVGIDTPNRDRDYTHAPVPTVANCCGLESYGSYVTTALKPWIDRNYRTIPDREHTFIGGSSHGGLAACFIATNYGDVFGGAACMSSSFWVDMVPFGPTWDLAQSSFITLVDPSLSSLPHPRLWLDWGLVRSGGDHNAVIEKNAASRGREMVSLLQKDYGYSSRNLSAVEDPQGEHSEGSWRRRLPQVLRFLLGTAYFSSDVEFGGVELER